MPTPLENNTVGLQRILSTIETLPAAGIQLPALTKPADAQNIQNGYEAIDGNGVKVVGTMAPLEVAFLSTYTVSSDGKSITIPGIENKNNFILFLKYSSYADYNGPFLYIIFQNGAFINNATIGAWSEGLYCSDVSLKNLSKNGDTITQSTSSSRGNFSNGTFYILTW